MVTKSKGQWLIGKTKVQWWNQSAVTSGENVDGSVLCLSYFQVFTLYIARRSGYWGGPPLRFILLQQLSDKFFNCLLWHATLMARLSYQINSLWEFVINAELISGKIHVFQCRVSERQRENKCKKMVSLKYFLLKATSFRTVLLGHLWGGTSSVFFPIHCWPILL